MFSLPVLAKVTNPCERHRKEEALQAIIYYTMLFKYVQEVWYMNNVHFPLFHLFHFYYFLVFFVCIGLTVWCVSLFPSPLSVDVPPTGEGWDAQSAHLIIHS